MDPTDFLNSYYFQNPDLAIIAKFKYDQIMGHHDPAKVSALYFKSLYTLWPILRSDYYWMDIYNKQMLSQIYFYSVIEPYNLKYFDICYLMPNHKMAVYTIVDAINMKILYCPGTGFGYCDKIAGDFAIQHKGEWVVGTLWFFPDSNPYGPSW